MTTRANISLLPAAMCRGRAAGVAVLTIVAATALASCGGDTSAASDSRRADAMALVQRIYDPYASGRRPLLGDCFSGRRCPHDLASRVTPGLARDLRRRAVRDDEDPVVCSQNLPRRVRYVPLSADHERVTIRVHTYYARSGDLPLTATVELPALRLQRLTCPRPATTPHAARTLASAWSPFAEGDAIRRGLHVVKRSGGSCDGTAHAPVTMAAQRCWVANEILDPCFEPRGGIDRDHPTVVCTRAPWRRGVVRLTLRRRPAPAVAEDLPATPWALRLTTGERCVFQQGAGGAVGRLRPNYACGENGPYIAGPYLFGAVDRRQGLWRIRASRDVGGHRLQRVTIARVWR